MLTRAEALLASAIAAPAAAITFAYVPYRAGWHVSPLAVLVLTLILTTACARWLWRRAKPSGGAMAAIAVVAGVAAYFLWLARPHLMPVGGGPDLAHHLVLINYIERAWRLVDDPALYPYLGDMMDYTPGSHLLIALAGAWTGVNAIRAVHAVIALTVALKAGVVFSIARRVASSTPLALAGTLLLVLPYEYFAGSFVTHSFWAQVVSELFACAAWWALVVWDDERWIGAMGLFALFGVATFLVWPIWIGPVALAAAAIILAREQVATRDRLRAAVTALAPIALAAAIHTIGKTGRLQMAGTSGFAIKPSIALIGWPFAILAVIGFVLAVRSRRARVTLALLAAIAIQALALAWVASRSGASAPYLALKMMYLAIYPLAVAAVCALPARPLPAWLATAAVAALAAWTAATAPRPKPIVTLSSWQAGRWAREHVDPACVDYLTADGYTGYWLHLAVLDNPRDTPRFLHPDTFEPQKAIARWVEPAGLPYAIVDDVDGFSRALFSGTETMAQFERSRVIKRLGNTSCQER